MAAIDAEIARVAERLGALSERRVETLIDVAVDAHDPQAREWFLAGSGVWMCSSRKARR